MKILLCHNKYQQKGGEDVVFSTEKRILTDHGHQVITWTKENIVISDLSKLKLIIYTLWNKKSYKEIRILISSEKPDVVHFHNTFPLMSPSVYWAAKKENIPVIKTIHNYRLLCPGALFFKKNKVCEKCLDKKSFLPAIKNRCYRNSILGTIVVSLMLRFHRIIGTYNNKIDKYLVLTKFAKDKFVSNMLSEGKVIIKPNSVEINEYEKKDYRFALFVGRLSEEKGIDVLVKAWKDLEIPLKIIGDGPSRNTVQELSGINPFITLVGMQKKNDIQKFMSKASFLVLPSVWYEGLPMTILESYASSLPVLASRHGSMSTCVLNGKTGLHFKPGDSGDLREKAIWMYNNPEDVRVMGINAKIEFEKKYSLETNYKQLMKVFNEVIEESRCKKLK